MCVCVCVCLRVIPDTTQVERALHGSLDLGSKFGQDVWEEIQYCGSFSPESLEDGLWRRLVFELLANHLQLHPPTPHP